MHTLLYLVAATGNKRKKKLKENNCTECENETMLNINGVEIDVTQCRHYDNGKCQFHVRCAYNDCYYQQLALSREESNNRLEAYLEEKEKYDKIKRWNKILNDCLDTKDELCKALREDNDNLRYKNELYLEKIKKLKGEQE